MPLKTGNYLVNEIGFAVGFNSHNYFSKSFKKQYGKTPSEFIKVNFDSSEDEWSEKTERNKMDIDANKKYHEPIKKPQYLNKNK